MYNNKIELFDIYFKQYLSRGITGCDVHKRWNYKDDLMVVGAYDIYYANKDEFYKNIIPKMAEHLLLEFTENDEYNLDSISAGKTDIIFQLITDDKQCGLEIDKTKVSDQSSDDKYKKRLQQKLERLKSHPRTQSNNFWHKNIYPNQVWLDGLYMCMPVFLQDSLNEDDAINQFKNVRKYLFDDTIRLYYHAWNEDKKQYWANKESGLSKSVWLRGEGWFLMALVDCYELVKKKSSKNLLKTLLKEAIDGILQYQDKESKMFLQVVDQKDLVGNYAEVSGSAMVAYTLMKGSRLEMLDTQYWRIGEEILGAIANTYLHEKDGKLILDGICASAGLGGGPDNRTDRDGTKEYYIKEAIIADNQHGTSACMMAYSEYLIGE